MGKSMKIMGTSRFKHELTMKHVDVIRFMININEGKWGWTCHLFTVVVAVYLTGKLRRLTPTNGG
jgi:hypothetical protein